MSERFSRYQLVAMGLALVLVVLAVAPICGMPSSSSMAMQRSDRWASPDCDTSSASAPECPFLAEKPTTGPPAKVTDAEPAVLPTESSDGLGEPDLLVSFALPGQAVIPPPGHLTPLRV